MDIDLSQSWIIGDGLTDVKAGKGAGTRTILLGRMKCELCHLMNEEDTHPDLVASSLLEAAWQVGGVLSPMSVVREHAALNSQYRTSDIEQG